MSAFICSDEHFASISKTLKLNSRMWKDCLPFIEGVDDSRQSDFEKKVDIVVSNFFRLNVESVNYRYRDFETRNDGFSSRSGGKNLAPIGLLKALQCLRYQSCEIPPHIATAEQNSNYNMLVEFCGRVAEKIVRMNFAEQYEKESWEIQQ